VHQRLHTYEGIAAVLAFAALYTFVAAQLKVGPPLLLPAIMVIGGALIGVLRWRGLFLARRVVAVAMLTVATAAVAVSAAFLIGALVGNRAQAGDLLGSAALLWIGNVLVFSLWYWEIDGGGPHHRKPGREASSDFLFPQFASGGEGASDWMPEFLDYLFLSFNTSTAFSPTDTMVLARRSKLLMMLQSLISLATVAVIAARAINTL
jgi:hypothetical protein